jgi:HD-GYP domain-containing protein (c-di-GMP phosphodiesterase class II)
VGKIGVSEQILNKKSKLTSAEFAHIQSHTITGEKILSTIESIRDGLSTVRHHHERLNGDGYPDGLSEVNIPLAARILAVADAYDAMTTKRPYRNAMTNREAIEELKSHAGKQFDPRVVRAFLAVVISRKANTKEPVANLRDPRGSKSLRTA